MYPEIISKRKHDIGYPLLFLLHGQKNVFQSSADISWYLRIAVLHPLHDALQFGLLRGQFFSEFLWKRNLESEHRPAGVKR